MSYDDTPPLTTTARSSLTQLLQERVASQRSKHIIRQNDQYIIRAEAAATRADDKPYYPIISQTALHIKQTLYPIDTLDGADIIQQRIKAYDILNIEAYRTLEDTIVRVDIYCAHIYAEVSGD